MWLTWRRGASARSRARAARRRSTVGSTGSTETRWVDAGAYGPADLLLVRVTWSPDSRRVVYQAQNREQTFLDLNAADADTGKSSKLFQEKTPAWVEPFDDNPHWLRDGSFLWR